MIKHIVMFKLKEEAKGKTAYENALEAKERALNLRKIIKEIRTMEVGINSSEAPASNFELVLVMDFDTIEDLNIYQVHPAHREFGEFISEIRTDRACIDYEY